MRLSQLCQLVQEHFRDAFAYQRFWIVAEISNHSFYSQKGFHYFDLIESEKPGSNAKGSLIAKISGVAWTAGAGKIRSFEAQTGQTFGNDIQVLLEVSVDYHPIYGLKLTLLDIDPAFTLGQLELQRKATIERLLQEIPDFVWLQEEQLCSFNKELALPMVIQRLAIISSATAAGYEDFEHSLFNNPFGYKFITTPFFTTVQGENNAPELAATFQKVISSAEESGIDYDAVVIIRGGGANTDLLLFDQFETAAAIASCPFPILTGIGHQKNETIADLVAHTSLKTPTKVAEYLIQYNRSFENSIISCKQGLVIKTQQFLAAAQQEFHALRSELVYQTQANTFHHRNTLLQLQSATLKAPATLLKKKESDRKLLEQKLPFISSSFLRHQQMQIENLIRLFRMASPESSLQRGFAILQLEGKIIANAKKIKAGDELTILFSDTEITTTVHHKKPFNGKSFDI